MSDYLKEILSEQVRAFGTKKNLINILILGILVLAIPLTINLVRQQQILFSKAATDTVQLVDNSCTTTQNNKKVLSCPTLTLDFVAPSEVEVISAQDFIKEAHAQNCTSGPAGGVTAAQAGCVLEKRSDIIPFYKQNGWCIDTGIANELEGIVNNWMSINNQADKNEVASCFGTVPIPTPTPTPVTPACPVTASCCSAPLQKCGTTSTFDGVSKDTSCPVGFQWCYGSPAGGGYCINENYDNKGTTGSCTPPDTTPACPVTASCCSAPLQKCGTTSTFDGVSKDTSCPVGFQWCYRAKSGAGGYCIKDIYDGKGTSGSCSALAFVCKADDYGPLSNKSQWCACAATNNDAGSLIRENCPQAPATAVSLTVSPSPVTKQNGKWPDLTLRVNVDSNTQWGVYYQNGPTCTVSSCTLQGWTLVGSISNGNGTVSWSSQSPNLQNVLAGIHTFAVLNNPPTKVLATSDIAFNEGTSGGNSVTQNIVKVRYAENSSDLTNLNIRREVSYQKGGVKKDITFVDSKAGAKFVYAQFVDDKGQTVNGSPYPFQIDLVGPTPSVSGFACEVNIASSAVPNSPSSDLLFTFQGINFGSQEGSINLASGGTVNVESWTNNKITGRLNNLPASSTVAGTKYVATLSTKAGQKSLDQQCLVGITQISLGAQIFCRAQRNFDQDNVELILINDKDKAQKSTEKVIIDKDGNISGIKTKLRVGDNYIACIKAPLSLRKCSVPFTASSGTNNLTINLPVGDYNGDGNINSVDGSLLRSQWGPMNASKNCDVNKDGFCNSFEWSCMLHDFNSSDQTIP